MSSPTFPPLENQFLLNPSFSLRCWVLSTAKITSETWPSNLFPGSAAFLLSWQCQDKLSEVNVVLSSSTTTCWVLNSSSKTHRNSSSVSALAAPIAMGIAAAWWLGQKWQGRVPAPESQKPLDYTEQWNKGNKKLLVPPESKMGFWSDEIAQATHLSETCTRQTEAAFLEHSE